MKCLRRERAHLYPPRGADAGGTPTLPSAFTLIEMLVTIVLIAILVTLIFSGIGMVQKKMQTIKCLSNLRQIGVALLAYAGDFNGKIPGRYTPDVTDNNGRYWPLRLLNLKYIDQPDIFFCPSYFPKNNKEARYPVANGAAQTYGMRDWKTPSASSALASFRSHNPLSAIRTPSDFFLVADSYWVAWLSQGYGITAYPGGVGDNRVHARHDGKANALFADGHAQAMPPDYFRTLNDPGRQPESQGDYAASSTSKFSVEENPNPSR